jgi:ABC-type antimicrobial peptide transport system permease subunit
VRFAEGISTQDGIDALRPDFGDTIEQTGRPADIESIDRVRGVPWLFAGLVVALAVAMVLHALFTGLRRQRHDLAVIKALGFGRRQIGWAGLLQASAFAAAAVLLGLPLGIVIGRQIWQRVIEGLGLEVGLATPVLGLVLVVPAVVVGALLLAALPARAAARTDPAAALHAD